MRYVSIYLDDDSRCPLSNTSTCIFIFYSKDVPQCLCVKICLLMSEYYFTGSEGVFLQCVILVTYWECRVQILSVQHQKNPPLPYHLLNPALSPGANHFQSGQLQLPHCWSPCLALPSAAEFIFQLCSTHRSLHTLNYRHYLST